LIRGRGVTDANRPPRGQGPRRLPVRGALPRSPAPWMPCGWVPS